MVLWLMVVAYAYDFLIYKFFYGLYFKQGILCLCRKDLFLEAVARAGSVSITLINKASCSEDERCTWSK